ncbi:hypothetical protein CLOM_g3598 [Closterium sp. NIES-68]|nr:hypothetical protein CLOM_g3598 [Closterium sp. NIES-68]GJP63705.1 hypothetical protein CLOP_g20763 [Closterium sp. NIES-67]
MHGQPMQRKQQDWISSVGSPNVSTRSSSSSSSSSPAPSPTLLTLAVVAASCAAAVLLLHSRLSQTAEKTAEKHSGAQEGPLGGTGGTAGDVRLAAGESIAEWEEGSAIAEEGSAGEMEGSETDGTVRTERTGQEWLGPPVAGGAESKERVGGQQGGEERKGGAETRGESGARGKDVEGDGWADTKGRGSGGEDGDEKRDEGRDGVGDEGDLPEDSEEGNRLKTLQAQAVNDWSNQIVLQGFHWESHHHPQGWWQHLTSLAPLIAAAGFTAVWLPPASSSLAPQGYLPRDLYRLASAYGSEADLRSLIAAFRAALPSERGTCSAGSAAAPGADGSSIQSVSGGNGSARDGLQHAVNEGEIVRDGEVPRGGGELVEGGEQSEKQLLPVVAAEATRAGPGTTAVAAAGAAGGLVELASNAHEPRARSAAAGEAVAAGAADATGRQTFPNAVGVDASGVRVIADVVVNHRVGSQQGEGGQWTRYDGTSMPWDETAVTCDTGGKGNPSSGSVFEGVSNIDHSHPFVRRDITAWLTWLQGDVGFSGFRFDYAKGYSPAYVRGYVGEAGLRLCVGEYWDTCNYVGPQYDLDYDQDSHRQRIVEWIEGAGRLAAAFDFTTKAVLQEAVKRKEWWRLKDKEGRPPGVIGLLPSHAVTFVDNHDTGSTQAHWPFPSHDVIQGYAYILTHPGIPSVFFDHFFDWGPDLQNKIQQLIDARRKACLHSRSLIQILAADGGRYAAIVGGRLCVKIGDADWSPDSYGLVSGESDKINCGSVKSDKTSDCKWNLNTCGEGYAVWIWE